MKIELNDWEDVRDFVAMMNPAYLREWNKQLGPFALSANIERETAYDMSVRCDEVVGHVPTSYDEPNGLPTDIEPPEGYAEPDDVRALRESLDALEERDADGALYDTRWHSEPKKLTDKGVFRARRGRDNDAYKAWLLEQAVAVAEATIAADEAEPVATETHALPQDEDSREVGAGYAGEGGKPTEPEDAPVAPASAVDLDALIALSREVLARHDGAHVTLLNDCKAFVDKHGHPAFTALKEAAVGGRSIPQLNEIEDRRLMQACIANYPSN